MNNSLNLQNNYGIKPSVKQRNNNKIAFRGLIYRIPRADKFRLLIPTKKTTLKEDRVLVTNFTGSIRTWFNNLEEVIVKRSNPNKNPIKSAHQDFNAENVFQITRAETGETRMIALGKNATKGDSTVILRKPEDGKQEYPATDLFLRSINEVTKGNSFEKLIKLLNGEMQNSRRAVQYSFPFKRPDLAGEYRL